MQGDILAWVLSVQEHRVYILYLLFEVDEMNVSLEEQWWRRYDRLYIVD